MNPLLPAGLCLDWTLSSVTLPAAEARLYHRLGGIVKARLQRTEWRLIVGKASASKPCAGTCWRGQVKGNGSFVDSEHQPGDQRRRILPHRWDGVRAGLRVDL
jgi:hypothetical protein